MRVLGLVLWGERRERRGMWGIEVVVNGFGEVVVVPVWVRSVDVDGFEATGGEVVLVVVELVVIASRSFGSRYTHQYPLLRDVLKWF